jgi:hypothetical protein
LEGMLNLVFWERVLEGMLAVLMWKAENARERGSRLTEFGWSKKEQAESWLARDTSYSYENNYILGTVSSRVTGSCLVSPQLYGA